MIGEMEHRENKGKIVKMESYLNLVHQRGDPESFLVLGSGSGHSSSQCEDRNRNSYKSPSVNKRRNQEK